MNSLPPEILLNIIHLISNPADIVSCCFVSKALWGCASRLLYCDIDLTSVGENTAPLTYFTKDKARQTCLIQSLLNPTLAGFVQTFRNHQERIVSWQNDSIDECNRNDLLAVARNMKSLRRAWLKSNVLGGYILRTLDLYPDLTELFIHGLKWQDYIWPSFLPSLTSLTWVVEDCESQMQRIPALLNMIETTCPLLKSLDIGFTKFRSKPITTARIPYVSPTGEVFLKHLQHLGIRAGIDVNCYMLPEYFRDFMKRHQESLKSLSIPYGREDISTLCEDLPKLKELAITSLDWHRAFETDISLDNLLVGLLGKLISLGCAIENITLEDMCYPITQRTFTPFGLCSGLKVLRIGNWMEVLKFKGLVDNLISVIPELPLSLEKFYFDTCCKIWPKDFTSLLLVAKPMFTSLHRLRVCDIRTWNIDKRKSEFPNMVLHCGRLLGSDESHISGDPISLFGYFSRASQAASKSSASLMRFCQPSISRMYSFSSRTRCGAAVARLRPRL